MFCNELNFKFSCYEDKLVDQRMIDGMLPAEFDLTGVELPSPKAGSYLRNWCMYLNVDLKGVR